MEDTEGTAVIQKYRYNKIPDMKIIGVKTTSTKYFFHGQEIVKMLVGNSKRLASAALHDFLQNQDGSRLRNGGDLITAFKKGDTSAMIYKYFFYGGSSPSYAFTKEAVKEMLSNLQHQTSDAHEARIIIEEMIESNNFQLIPNNEDHITGVKRPIELESGIYVLKFDESPYYYVGKSTNIPQRLNQHANGQGAACATGRPFQRVYPLTHFTNDTEIWERNEVLELMFRRGINAVRGWKYTLKTMTLEQKLSAFDDVCERYDLCRRCGRGDHFVRECDALTTDRWTNGLEVRTMYRSYTSVDEQNDQIEAINAELDKEREARATAEARAEAEHQARLNMQRRNAEAIRLLNNT
jgi:predicted GIY-YIG superfamily endonuclease